MPVIVAGPDRDHGHARPDEVQEGLARRGPRSVVGDLQQVDRREPARDELGIDVVLHVARQEEAPAGDGAEEDDRAVVRGAVVRRVARGQASGIRPQHPEVDRAEREPRAGGERRVGDRPIGDRGLQRLVAGPVAGEPRLVHATDAIAVQEEREAGSVVLMRVAQDDEVDPVVPRREALVEDPDEPRRIRAAVDEEPPAVGRLHEDRIALPDVEDRDRRDAGWPLDDRDCERERGAGERRHRPAAASGGACRAGPARAVARVSRDPGRGRRRRRGPRGFSGLPRQPQPRDQP